MTSTVVGRIMHVKLVSGAPQYSFGYSSTVGQFHAIQTGGDGALQGEAFPVPGVILRAASDYNHFSVAQIGQTVELNDIIKTAPDAILALEFAIGGRVGVNKDSAVKVTSERSVSDCDVTLYRSVMRKFGLFSKIARLKEPLEIQTNGGVLGIKG